LLPLAVGFAIAQIEPEAMGKLFNTMAGWAVCALIVVLELLGFWFIRKIVAIDV
jgi:tight adherence protein B